jgi:hypothetical protein
LIADNVSAEWALAYSSVISLICVGVAGAYWRAGNRAGTSELTSGQLTGPAPRADSRPT